MRSRRERLLYLTESSSEADCEYPLDMIHGFLRTLCSQNPEGLS